MRIVGWVFLGVVIFSAAIGGIWRTAYNWESRLPNQLNAVGLESPAEIHWGEFNTAEIQANSLPDALLGLGYVQGKLNGWTIALWRQAALGKLSDWYGSEAVEADRIIRLLGLPENAQRASEHLSLDEASLIAAFGKGIQLGWQDADHMHEFFLQGITPEPWEPWHTLAIERLIAWMSAVPDSVCNLGESVCTDIAKLDSIILLHGSESSSSWVLPTSQGPLLYQRHVLGRAVSPTFQEVVLNVADSFEMHGASLIGTPFFPAGKIGNRAWSILLYSPKTTRPVRFGPSHPLRFRFPDREEIVSYQRSDSTFSIHGMHEELFWSGLGTENDIHAWFALLRNQPPTFQLWRGDGILISSDSSWTVLGEPEFVFPIHPSGLVISNDSSAEHSAHYLRSIDLDVTDPSYWITDTWSPWVASTLPRELDSLRIPANAPVLVQSALVYLENWNHAFEGKSIGATIYNEWITSEGETREMAFHNAIDQLAQKFGPDQSQWLWERVYADKRLFTLHGHLDSRMHTPLTFSLVGHESTMLWGGAKAATAPVTWEGWTWSEPSSPYFIRRQNLNLQQPFGRYISEKSDPSIFPLPHSRMSTTILVPDDFQ